MPTGKATSFGQQMALMLVTVLCILLSIVSLLQISCYSEIKHHLVWEEKALIATAVYGCHQIREFKEDLGILLLIRANQEKESFSEKSGKSLVLFFCFRVVTFSMLNHTSSLV